MAWGGWGNEVPSPPPLMKLDRDAAFAAASLLKPGVKRWIKIKNLIFLNYF
jgi:hypothetical protein